MDLVGGLLLNGSMIQDAASPTLGQRILRSAVGPLFSRLSSERFFRQQFGSIFSPGHPLTDEEADDQWELICAGGGRTLNHKTIAYMEERFKHADRWHGALRDWEKPLALAWGMLDPVGDRGRPGRRPGAAAEARRSRASRTSATTRRSRIRRGSRRAAGCPGRLTEPLDQRQIPALYCRASPGPS